MPAEVRLALVGTGRIGRVHAGSYARVARGRLVACTDLVPESAQRFGRDFGLEVCPDLDSILRRGDIDGVIIATPNWLHAEMTVASLAAGKHVFCQKPIALDLEGADRVLEAATASGCVLQLGFMLRFTPPIPEVRALVASGALGRVIACNAAIFGWEPNADWFYDKATGGGVILDTLIHFADLASWVAGDVERVHAEGGAYLLEGSKKHGSPDNASILMRHVGGATTTVYVTWTAGHGNFTFEVYGSNGSLNVDLVEKQASRLFLRRPVRSETQALASGHSFPDLVWAYSYANEQQYFVDQIASCASPGLAATPEDARRALAVALAAQRALDEGGVVVL
ncbi:MAG: Gfo/Idh/MocA family protein [Candidatus Dormibacteraceae bacterium]